jgi:hypothetical protein
VHHKWYDGNDGGWGPSDAGSSQYYERLGGISIQDIKAVSRASNILDLFIITANGSTQHKAYGVEGWYPDKGGNNWENQGGVSISSVV